NDLQDKPRQSFYTIAADLAMVCFVWRMTEDAKYAGVKERAVIWAGYPPGGRASPEGLGGDGHEDATQGNEFLALLFDWLYTDLDDGERQVMIRSLEWRTEHIMNTFSWRAKRKGGAMLRLTFRTGAKASVHEAEDLVLAGAARVLKHKNASGGKLVEFGSRDAVISTEVTLAAGPYAITVQGCGPGPNKDAFYVVVDNQKPKRAFIQEWGEAALKFTVKKGGKHTVKILPDPKELGMQIDAIRLSVHADQRLRLRRTPEWRDFQWEVAVPSLATEVVVEPFNYYARGEVWWDSVHVAAADGEELLKNPDFSRAQGKAPAHWRGGTFRTEAELGFDRQAGRGQTGAVGILCSDSSERGAWAQTISVKNRKTLSVSGWYRTSGDLMTAAVRSSSLSGMAGSHQYESSMDTAVCGLVLYEHSAVGKEWFELMLNYLVGVTCSHGFDEAWNEGAGYGTSKCKWLMNATMYFDTALPSANLGLNPFYRRIGDWFCRVVPMGMDHHAWGNQRNASRGNHLAHMRKFAFLTGEGRFLLNWQQYGGTKFSKWRPWIEYVLPAYYDAPEPHPETENSAVFPIAGWAMAASGPPSLASTYEQGVGVIFQCRPRGGYSHSFNSDNSFQLHAYGQMLNHGGGSSGNQDAYAYHTMSHNTLLVDGLGQAQPGRGQLYPTYGRLVGSAQGDDYVYFAGDATRCYPRKPGNYSRWGLPLHKVYQKRALPHLERFVRHILFIRDKYFVIYDELASSQPSTYTWLYHIRPDTPFRFDPKTFTIDYSVKDVRVRMRHLADPDKLRLDDRQGLDGFINPLTGEDYRKWRKGDILCGHNLWISNEKKAKEWHFLTVIYPLPPGSGGEMPPIIRIDDATVRVGHDTICFDPASSAAEQADFVIDTVAIRQP
ncbi:MAG: heparinase II/III family protein, partial [Lentisphaeria bacterium]|nr:heparinase II/III family protein [Lentisphaeria bacterium]